jgi:transposase
VSTSTAASARGRGRPLQSLLLSVEERRILQRWIRSRASPPKLALRAQMVLACAEGLANIEVARRLEVGPHTVGRWRTRFLSQRLGGLAQPASPGAPPRLSHGARAGVAAVIGATVPATADWSTRRIALRGGFSQSSASRIIRELALEPGRAVPTGARRSIDLQRVVGLVGFHVNLSLRAFALLSRPPNAPVVSVATADSPAGAAWPPLRSHLGALEESLHHTAALSHRRRSSLKLRGFLKTLEQQAPDGHEIHVIATSPEPFGPAVRRWLAKHPPIHLHRPATRAAWRHLLAGWCRALSTRPDATPILDGLALAVDAGLRAPTVEPLTLTWTCRE